MQSRTKYFKEDFLFFIFGRGCGWSWEGVNYNIAAEIPLPHSRGVFRNPSVVEPGVFLA